MKRLNIKWCYISYLSYCKVSSSILESQVPSAHPTKLIGNKSQIQKHNDTQTWLIFSSETTNTNKVKEGPSPQLPTKSTWNPTVLFPKYPLAPAAIFALAPAAILNHCRWGRNTWTMGGHGSCPRLRYAQKQLNWPCKEIEGCYKLLRDLYNSISHTIPSCHSRCWRSWGNSPNLILNSTSIEESVKWNCAPPSKR